MLEVGVRRVAGDVDVHPHAGEERLEGVAADAPGARGVDRGPADRVVAVAAVEVGEELVAPADEGRRVGAVEVVDQLVGVPREAVERVDVRPLGRRQQQRGEVVRLAVRSVQPPAALVGRPQRRVGDPRRVQLPPAHRSDSPHADALRRSSAAPHIGAPDSVSGVASGAVAGDRRSVWAPWRSSGSHRSAESGSSTDAAGPPARAADAAPSRVMDVLDGSGAAAAALASWRACERPACGWYATVARARAPVTWSGRVAASTRSRAASPPLRAAIQLGRPCSHARRRRVRPGAARPDPRAASTSSCRATGATRGWPGSRSTGGTSTASDVTVGRHLTLLRTVLDCVRDLPLREAVVDRRRGSPRRDGRGGPPRAAGAQAPRRGSGCARARSRGAGRRPGRVGPRVRARGRWCAWPGCRRRSRRSWIQTASAAVDLLLRRVAGRSRPTGSSTTATGGATG